MERFEDDVEVQLQRGHLHSTVRGVRALECQVQEDQLLTQIKTKTLCDNLHLVLNTEYTHHTHITQVRRMEQTKSNRLSRIHLNVLRVTYSTTE